MNHIVGELSLHYEGYGFVIPNKPGQADVFIPARLVGDAFHGDQVEVKIKPSSRGLWEGSIVRILKRGLKQIVGRLESHGKQWVLAAEDQRVKHRMIITSTPHGFHPGDYAVAKILQYPEGDQPLQGEVLSKLPERGSLHSEIEYVIAKHQWPTSFPKEVGEEAKGIKNRTMDRKQEGESRIRKDLRDLPFVTIDGDDAKDFDDAVCGKILEGGLIRIWVAIADVSHYVVPNSFLDKEAYERGTSVYFPGRVLPMLPEALSNDLCSLKPKEDRLALVAEFDLDVEGNVVREDFYSALFQSHARLTYFIVKHILEDRKKEFLETYSPLVPLLETLSRAAHLLRAQREKRGSLDFDLPEPEIILDFTGGIADIEKAQRFWSHQIIEELMIAANESVARFLTERKAPCIYRIHEGPDPQKIRSFFKTVQRLGYRGHFPSEVKSQGLRKILQHFKGHPEERLVNTLLLRSMAQAVYSAANRGHFGLASLCYCHFTSPIRRYPDLVVHRLLKAGLRTRDPSTLRQSSGQASLRAGQGSFDSAQDRPETKKTLEKKLEEIAAQSSTQERKAMSAEREMLSLHQTIFMAAKKGEAFEGIISHVTKFGFFVELLDYFVEGLVLREELKEDNYAFDEEHLCLKGRSHKKVYKIGDRLFIRVQEANIPERRIFFKLLDTASKP